jgi:hypothetical protein
MADEKEPRAITYKEVERAVGKTANARDTWEKIGMLVGAGRVPAGDDAAIDLTGASDGEVSRIDEILGKAEAKKEDAKTSAKSNVKDGAK